MIEGSFVYEQGLPVECIVLGREQDDICGGFDPDQDFKGLMDNLLIYNRTLSNKEIFYHYETLQNALCNHTCASCQLPDQCTLCPANAQRETVRDSLDQLCHCSENYSDYGSKSQKCYY